MLPFGQQQGHIQPQSPARRPSFLKRQINRYDKDEEVEHSQGGFPERKGCKVKRPQQSPSKRTGKTREKKVETSVAFYTR